jgi:hypothetical protein
LTLRRQEAPRTTTLKSGRLRIATGYFLTCPAGGPVCKVTATLKRHRTGRTALSLGTVRMTVPAGERRELLFTVTARGERLLSRSESLPVTLRSVVRFGARVQVRIAKLTVKLPS